MAYSPIPKGSYDDAAKRAGHQIMDRYAGPEADARLAVRAVVGPHTMAQAALAAVDIKLTEDQLARLDAAGA